jgi:hypothetical protein
MHVSSCPTFLVRPTDTKQITNLSEFTTRTRLSLAIIPPKSRRRDFKLFLERTTYFEEKRHLLANRLKLLAKWIRYDGHLGRVVLISMIQLVMSGGKRE